jgi:Spy/CpxP family protein refolding chaperone
MKKTIALAVLLFGLVTFAQERPADGKGKQAKMERRQDMTAEQRAELQVKKMTLELDLTPKQQTEVQKLVLAQAKKREAKQNEMKSKREKGEKSTDEERFNNKSQVLDEQIAMKAEFKKIFTAEQIVKFEENKANRSEKMQEKRNQGKRKGMEKK